MTNSIELLETIGGDASLRHAAAHELERALSDRQPSHDLLRAAESGERSSLARELGFAANQAVQAHDSPVQGGFEDEEEDGSEDDFGDDGDDIPARDRS